MVICVKLNLLLVMSHCIQAILICHLIYLQLPRDCDFPVHQLTKVVWGPLRVAAPEAFHIISKMSFSDLEYDQLIANASQNSDLSLTRIACRWVQENEHKWEKWLPTSLMEKPKIYLGGLFPLTGKSWSQPGLVEGKKLVTRAIVASDSVMQCKIKNGQIWHKWLPSIDTSGLHSDKDLMDILSGSCWSVRQ